MPIGMGSNQYFVALVTQQQHLGKSSVYLEMAGSKQFAWVLKASSQILMGQRLF